MLPVLYPSSSVSHNYLHIFLADCSEAEAAQVLMIH